MEAMKLWIGNIDPATTDDELRELVRKYTKLEVSRITREPGDGSRPAAVLEFDEASREVLYEAERRLNGLYWKNRTLGVHAPL
jgi:RNA recognition motif-containing protein